MPGFNGQGPDNQGPMSGRGLGKCRPPADSTADEEPQSQDQLKKIDPNQVNDNSDQVYGQGRGGRPRGGGQGRGLGGGRGSGRGGRGQA